MQWCCYYWAVFAGLQLLPAPACEKLLIFLFLGAVPESSGQPNQQIWHWVKRTTQYALLFQEELPWCMIWSQKDPGTGLDCTTMEVLFILTAEPTCSYHPYQLLACAQLCTYCNTRGIERSTIMNCYISTWNYMKCSCYVKDTCYGLVYPFLYPFYDHMLSPWRKCVFFECAPPSRFLSHVFSVSFSLPLLGLSW